MRTIAIKNSTMIADNANNPAGLSLGFSSIFNVGNASAAEIDVAKPVHMTRNITSALPEITAIMPAAAASANDQRSI